MPDCVSGNPARSRSNPWNERQSHEGPGAAGLIRGWYRAQLVFYFDFNEASLVANNGVPTSPIHVAFNTNPDQSGGGPASGFMTQGSSAQTHNVIATLPGDPGYSPLWSVIPYDNASFDDVHDLASAAAAPDFGFAANVNCPIVPDGSTASLRIGGGDTGLTRGWHNGEVVYYFNFAEAPLAVTASGDTPATPIYVSFNINPDQAGGGPPSGFMTEPGSSQTHNVLAALPGDAGYSPLWSVFPYDNAAFAMVTDLASAQAAMNFGLAALVNCPVVQ